MRFGLLIAALALLVPAAPALAGGSVTKGPTPSWVDELAVPQPKAARLRQAEDGVYYLIDDTQIRPDKDVIVTYYRSVSKAVDRGGLESTARLDIEFDPDYEDIVVHRLSVLRDGRAIDRLESTGIEILQREKDLDNGVMDGRKTAHLEIADVRVGDAVDIAYSRVEHPKLWPGQLFTTMQTDWSVPLSIWRERILWPKDWPIAIRNRSTTLAPRKSAQEDRTLYEWRQDDHDPIPSEDGTPDWYATWGHVSVSSVADWRGIVAGTVPLYAGKDRLPPALAAWVRTVVTKYPRPEDRITEALRLVQDQLRYVSLSMGAGSYVPRDAETAWRSGFGDCKDKASLLAALLNAMGIEAHVALTDIDEGRSLPQVAPSPYVFDHAITQVKLGGKTYWLEPTRSHEGGRFPHIAGVPYGFALPLVPGQTGLEAIPAPAAPTPTETTTERYVLANDGALTLRVATVYEGADADWMRDNIVSKSISQIEKDYLKFYRGLYPGLAVAEPVRFTDERDADRVSVYESYSLSAAALNRNGLKQKFPVKASALNDYDDEPQDGRRAPFDLAFPVNKKQIIIVATPTGGPQAPDSASVDNLAFRYRLDAKNDGTAMVLSFTLTGKLQTLMPKDVARFRKDVDTVKDDNYWDLNLDGFALNFTTAPEAPRPDRNLPLLLLAGLALAGIFGYALHLGLHADDDRAKDSYFYPVDAAKFLMLSAATAGLYAMFWAWKCWRWTAIQEKRVIAPFWRAFFSLFWLYPLFKEVNRRGASRFWGALAAVLYPLLAIAAGVLSVMHPHWQVDVVEGLVTGVFFLPALFAVNALNAGNPALRENSKIDGLSLLAAAAGVGTWLAILLNPI